MTGEFSSLSILQLIPPTYLLAAVKYCVLLTLLLPLLLLIDAFFKTLVIEVYADVPPQSFRFLLERV
jgi:hypothetical protein